MALNQATLFKGVSRRLAWVLSGKPWFGLGINSWSFGMGAIRRLGPAKHTYLGVFERVPLRWYDYALIVFGLQSTRLVIPVLHSVV